jgi:uncharacterized membrane protein YgcG
MSAASLSRYRPLVTTFVLFTFLVIAATGLALYFRWFPFGAQGRWRQMHEWFSLAFVAISLVHLLMNWTPVKCYFTRRSVAWQWLGACAAAMVLMAVMFSYPAPEHGRGGGQGRGRDRTRVEAQDTNNSGGGGGLGQGQGRRRGRESQADSRLTDSDHSELDRARPMTTE